MRKRRWLVLGLALLTIAAVACVSGSVSGSRRSCTQRGSTGQCSGSYRSLSGTYTEDIEDERIYSGSDVQVAVSISVEEGTVVVSFDTPDGEQQSAEARPGAPATLSGIAEGDMEGLSIRFQATSETASGVAFEIEYALR